MSGLPGLAVLQSEGFVTLLAALSAFLAVAAVWRGLLDANPLRGRLKELEQKRDALKQGLVAAPRRAAPARSIGLMRRLMDRFNLLRDDVAAGIATRLASAGLRSKDAVVAFFFCKLALPAVCAGLALLGLELSDFGELPFMQRLLVVLAAATAGCYVPDIYLRNVIDRRRDRLRKGLPDALDLLVICTQAGLSLEAAIGRVAREIGASSPEIADELGLTAVELGFLPDRHQALRNLSQRTGLPAIESVVNTLLQTERYGTPLAQSLRVLAAEYRNERMLRAEEKAARLPAMLTVPMIVFILPVLFVVLLGPAIIKTIDGLGGL